MFKEEKYKEIPKNDIMYDLDMPKTACVYEFTGSIPRPPVNEEERESYKELLNFPVEESGMFEKNNVENIDR